MSTAATARTAQSVLGDERIVSADSHIMEPVDLWEKNLTPSLKEKYPKFPQRNSPGEKPGGWDPKARIGEMEVDGVSAEVLYPTAACGYSRSRTPMCKRRASDRERLDDRLLQGGAGPPDGHPDDLALQPPERDQGAGALQEVGPGRSLMWQVPAARPAVSQATTTSVLGSRPGPEHAGEPADPHRLQRQPLHGNRTGLETFRITINQKAGRRGELAIRPGVQRRDGALPAAEIRLRRERSRLDSVPRPRMGTSTTSATARRCRCRT